MPIRGVPPVDAKQRRAEPRKVAKTPGWMAAIKRWWTGPHQKLLLILTLIVGIYGQVVSNADTVKGWFTAHSLPAWILFPFGAGPLLIWSVLFAVNEIALRAAGTTDRYRWLKKQNIILGKVSGNIIDTLALRRNHGGKLNESDGKLLVRSFLARVVEYASLYVNDPDVEFRACCLKVHRRDSYKRNMPDDFLQAWEYDSSHPNTSESIIPFGVPLAGEVATRKQPLIVDDCKAAEWAPYFTDVCYDSVVGFPLLLGNQLFGVVTIDATKTNVFSEQDAAIKIGSAISPILASIVMVLELASSDGSP